MDLDLVIELYIESIWEEYDDDNSGELDKQETRRFLEDLFSATGESLDFSAEEFESFFNEFDENGDGTIHKTEMREFLKSVCGL